MARIESKDVIQPDLLKPLRDEMDLTITKAQKLSDGLVIVMKNQAKIAEQTKKSAAGYKALTEAELKSIDALKKHTSLQKNILDLKNKEATLLNKEEALKQKKLRTEQMIARQAEKNLKITQQQNSAYFKLTKTIDKLTAEYRDLLVAEGKETAQTRKMRDEILKLNAIRNKANEPLGMHQNKVGQYQNALNGLNRTLGQLGLAFGAFQILRDTFGIVSASEDAFASLSAITGLTGEKFDVFKGAIMNTATELKVSGTVVAEAAEKIASAQPALLQDAEALASVTKEAITLNKAIKGDLTETSMALVGVMNQFSLGAEDASRVINVLAAGSQAGAATVNQINESMVKFGSTAKLLNISVEESVGAIETLGEKAIFGADAGTALRNILLKMSAIDVLPQKAMKELEKYGVNTDIVKDKTLSFEERLKELSKIAGDSAAIVKVFGTENATAATVLLNSLGTYEKMTDAVTGTNVAQQQAAINSDTLSAVIGELRAAWENLVIKWSEGTDVAGSLKSVLRFIAENLETILTWVYNGAKAWLLYKSALQLVNKEGTGMIQMFKGMIKGVVQADGTIKKASFNMKTFAKGMLGFAGILMIVIPLLIDAGKAIWELFDRTTALEKVTEKYNQKIIEERTQMDKLRYAIETTTAGSKERQLVIDEINAKYGTTLENISDEKLFMEQLAEAYKKVNAEMEKRIMQQLIEEELTEAFRKKRELEQAKKDAGEGVWWNPTSMIGLGFNQMDLDNVNEDIKALQDELFRLNQQAGETGKTLTRLGIERNRPGTTTGTEKKKKIDPLEELRKKNASELLALENELIAAGLDRELIDQRLYDMRITQYNQEIQMINELKYSQEEYNKTLNEKNKFVEEGFRIIGAEIEKINNAPAEFEQSLFGKIGASIKDTKTSLADLISSIRESIRNTMTMISEMMEANSAMLDNQIAKQNQILDQHISKEQELREIAKERGLDATESIDAEREAQKKARAEIDRLEQKKRNLEMMIAAMKLLADGKSLGEIKENLGQIKSYVEGSFYEGTPYTFAEALGRTNTRDGHVVRVDDNESILNPDQTRALGIGKGGNSTQDIVDWYKKSMRMAMPEAKLMLPPVHDNRLIAKKLDILIEATATLPENMPKYDSFFNSQVGYFEFTKRMKNRTIKTRYIPK
jgi:TP901 family phage tail tape measure protein